MKCCDTCRHFVLLPGRVNREGWCNAVLPEWAEEVDRFLGTQASLVKPDAGQECAAWQDAPLP